MKNEVLLLKINRQEHTDIYPDIISVEAEEDEKLVGVFNIRLAIGLQKDGSWTWIDDERLKVWNKISISAGFIDNLKEVISGYITQVRPYFDAELSQCYLDIKGMDTSVLMNTEEKIKDWANKKDSDIAARIFTQYGLIPEVESTEIVHREAVSTIIQRETDLQFLKRLARRNGFECFVRGNIGYFRSPQLTGNPMKTLAVQFGTESNLSYFKAGIDAQQPAKVEMHQLDLLTRENLDVSIESTRQHRLGRDSASSLYQGEVEPVKVLVKHTKVNDQLAMQALCQGLYDEAEWMLEGEGEIIGALYRDVLRARELVTIKGVGKTYSGVYYVTKVKHIFTGSGYVQEFKVKRNALNPEGTESFGSGVKGAVFT